MRYSSIIRQYLSSNDWKYQCTDDESEFFCVYSGNFQEQWILRFRISQDHDEILVYSQLDTVDEKFRDDVAFFVTHANFGLHVGAFELDYTDGDFRFRTSIDAERIDDVESVLDNLVKRNVTTVERYLPGVKAIICDGVCPIDACQSCEDDIRY
ncbi:hypothetical protein P9112_007911 [Eukaryota sp. TZLM1-RC]